jgi:Fe-S cluster assembly protein SufD
VTGEVSASQIAPFAIAPHWHTLVFVNGRYNASLSGGSALPAGVRVLPLARAYEELPAVVEQYLGTIAAFDAHTFTALNTRSSMTGAVVHVAANAETRRARSTCSS